MPLELLGFEHIFEYAGSAARSEGCLSKRIAASGTCEQLLGPPAECHDFSHAWYPTPGASAELGYERAIEAHELAVHYQEAAPGDFTLRLELFEFNSTRAEPHMYELQVASKPNGRRSVVLTEMETKEVHHLLLS